MSMTKLSDEITKFLSEMIRIEHYATDKNKDNWRVYLGDKQIGDLHDDPDESGCVGGQIGDFTDTGLFDLASSMAVKDLEIRQSIGKEWKDEFKDETPEVKIHESIEYLKYLCTDDHEHALYGVAMLLQSILDEWEEAKYG